MVYQKSSNSSAGSSRMGGRLQLEPGDGVAGCGQDIGRLRAPLPRTCIADDAVAVDRLLARA